MMINDKQTDEQIHLEGSKFNMSDFSNLLPIIQLVIQ